MKNILSYYYGLHPNEIFYKKDKYFFDYINSKYVFEIFNRPLSDAISIYNVDKQMINNNLLVHEIIINKENKILTYVNDVPYILMEIYTNCDARITLNNLCHINNNSVNIECDEILSRENWIDLWESKNDYFELQINEIGKKYPNLCIYANYYIGLAENAISYIRNVLPIEMVALKSICHKRINCNDSEYSLYNPIEFIYDYRIRDICEYIKSAFFCDYDAINLVYKYFNINYISYKEALLFYGRLLYPSYFFDVYEKIINENLDEKLIDNIVLKADEYERFLFDVYIFLSKLYNRYIPSVDWIIKRS